MSMALLALPWPLEGLLPCPTAPREPQVAASYRAGMGASAPACWGDGL